MKTEKYWELHKEVYVSKLDALSLDISNKVLNNPHGPEGKRLEKNVDRVVNRILNKESKNKKHAGRV